MPPDQEGPGGIERLMAVRYVGEMPPGEVVVGPGEINVVDHQFVTRFVDAPEMWQQHGTRCGCADCLRRERERHEGDMRATKLLYSHLNEEQRRTFTAYGYFTVRGRLHEWMIGKPGLKVRRQDWDMPPGSSSDWFSVCVSPGHPDLPIADVWLSQLLLIKADDHELARIGGHY